MLCGILSFINLRERAKVKRVSLKVLLYFLFYWVDGRPLFKNLQILHMTDSLNNKSGLPHPVAFVYRFILQITNNFIIKAVYPFHPIELLPFAF